MARSSSSRILDDPSFPAVLRAYVESRPADTGAYRRQLQDIRDTAKAEREAVQEVFFLSATNGELQEIDNSIENQRNRIAALEDENQELQSALHHAVTNGLAQVALEATSTEA